MGFLKRVTGQRRFEEAMSEIAREADEVVGRGGGYVEVREDAFPPGRRRLDALAGAAARYLQARGYEIAHVDTPNWSGVARIYVNGRAATTSSRTSTKPTGSSQASPLLQPTVRQLVRMATTEGNYGAVQDAYELLAPDIPPGTHPWAWWIGELERLSPSEDPEFPLYLKFARDAAYIEPWGDLPDGASDRLSALGG